MREKRLLLASRSRNLRGNEISREGGRLAPGKLNHALVGHGLRPLPAGKGFGWRNRRCVFLNGIADRPICRPNTSSIPLAQDHANKWKIGGVTGLAVDKDDNVWVLDRPNDLRDMELKAELNPPPPLLAAPVLPP